MGRPKKYKTEEERKAAKKEYGKQWRQEHKEEVSEYMKQYYQTPIGRAGCLLSAYRREDEKYNRGECTLTAQWIMDNIFTKPCAHCGKTGWEIIGCNRIDNSLPHTPDNVEPCCLECNVKLAAKGRERDEFGKYKKENPVN